MDGIDYHLLHLSVYSSNKHIVLCTVYGLDFSPKTKTLPFHKNHHKILL